MANIGLNGMSKDEIIVHFFGDLKRWPVEPDGHNWTQLQIEKIAEHIEKTGDCLWHAMSVVMVWTNCHCADCTRKGGAR